jgi:hypothetical protein
MGKFINISEDFKDKFEEVYGKKAFTFTLKYEFLAQEKQKQLIKISKIPDQYAFLMGKDLLVTVNEDLFEAFDDESVNILIEQELDRISYDGEKDKITMIKPDLNTFSSLINKYGIDKVGKANQIQDLYDQQKKDGTTGEKSTFVF